MSRISHKLFTIEIAVPPAYASYDSTTRIYAINYNVLHINSGLAGLKF